MNENRNRLKSKYVKQDDSRKEKNSNWENLVKMRIIVFVKNI